MKQNFTPHTHNSSPFLTLASIGTILALTVLSGRAMVVGPYTVDDHTLHLWHLDESAVPAVDAAPGGTNLMVLANSATLGNSSYTGFGAALSTAALAGSYLAPRTLVNGAGDDVVMRYADPITGAFTYEALVRIDFDPATFNRGNVPLYIITGENDGTASTRAFQFRMHTNGVAGSGVMLLHLFNPNGSVGLLASIPSTGPNAIAQGNWYHAAATYDGNAGGADNLKLYWTRMDQVPSPLEANLIGSGTMANDLPASATPDFALGNVGRGSINGNFVGLIDEVRMSKIARHPMNMLFSPEAVTILSQPVVQTVEVGERATLSVIAAGAPPLSYQWRLNGTPIPGATESVYSISSAQVTDSGSYDVVVTNNVPSQATSDVAQLTVEFIPVTIITDPASDIVAIGQPASFHVVASGTEPLSYQWRRNGLPIEGATNNLYAILSADSGDAGTYDVVVTNPAPSISFH